MTSRIGWAAVMVVLAMVAGCAGPSASPDAAATADAAMAHDAATARDTGALPDALPDAATLPDVGTVHDGGSDAFSATDTGSDAFAGHDANASADVGVDAFCNLPPPPCAAPPAGCHYENPGCGTCGTLVCAPADCSPACDVSHYCDHCGAALSCTTRPTPSIGICPDVFIPVCGCDGVTYSNSCELGHAMIPQWHTGACDGDVTL